jgi:hypothetical protein
VKGFGRQMRQLVSHFIVPEDDETTLLAAKGMLKGEMGVPSITFLRR